MAKIKPEIIDTILQTAKIVDVVGDFVKLKKKGVRYLGLCPFHNDKHLGSFVVYPRGNCYKCFSCDEKGGVVDFLMKHEHLSYPDAIRWLGKKYCIETDTTDFDYTPPEPKPLPPPLPMLTLPMSMVISRQQLHDNNLAAWMTTIHWDSIQLKRLPEVLAAYHLGTTRKGWAIFWQIDEQKRVHTGKMMEYQDNGHRMKGEGYHSDWIHAALFRDTRHPEYDEDKQEMKQCLYGLHLLNTYKRTNIDQTVCIVESEKTALLMATAYGNNAKQVWMACGGIESLSAEKLKPIIDQGRKIVLYPDRDGITKWQAKAEQIGYDRLTVDSQPVTKWWQPEDGAKADIADVVVRMIQQSTTCLTLDEVKRIAPQIAPIIEKLNLKITKQ